MYKKQFQYYSWPSKFLTLGSISEIIRIQQIMLS